jgi:hypothetical protein
LLLVLDRPDIPLHNNGAESAICEYVKKRKISGSTRSETGRQFRDTFTSLKKTCPKLGLSFWQYLKDRIETTNLIPDLSELIREHELKPGWYYFASFLLINSHLTQIDFLQVVDMIRIYYHH